MADLSITGTTVAPLTTATSATFTNRVIKLGETVTGGMLLYLKSSDGLWYKAKANGTAEVAGSGGLLMASTAGTSGQWIVGLGAGSITIGAGSVGVIYAVSAAAFGAIAPYSDLASTNQVNVIGQVVSTGVLAFNPVLGTALA